jgi:hypothetical protein
VGFSEIIEDNGDTIKLRTFVYLVYHGGSTGWFPCEPGDARMAYSVLGMTQPTSGVGPRDGDTECHVLACSPNPFRAETSVSFHVPRSGKVTVSIFDVTGRRVCQLLEKHCRAGINHVRWNGRDSSGDKLADGVYMIVVESSGSRASSKITLVR